MRVGIYTHYAHCDATYLAIRIAGLLHNLGIEFDFYAPDHPGKLGVPYDRAVVTREISTYTEWAKKHKIIIWTHVPTIEQISFARRRGIKTVVAPMWQELIPPFKKAIKRADAVISLFAECYTLFTDIYKIKSTQLIPFDTGLPIIKKTGIINERKIRLLLPWFDRNARCAGGLFLDNLRFLIERMPEAYLTVAFTPSRFAPSIAQFFKNMQRRNPERITLIRGVAISDRHKLFSEHDLTIFPAECDNYGMCGLLSLTAGTPVISTAISPQIDFLYPDSNCALVSTKIDYDENGVVHALPDYGKFARALQEMIAEPRLIQKLNQKTNYDLNTRRKAFEMSWTNVLDI